MNLYRNTDGTWVGTKAEAEKDAAKIDVPINPKSAVIAFLNGLNEERCPMPHVPNTETVAAMQEIRDVSEANTAPTTPLSISLDEQVATAPLRRRLGWAVEAIDAAESMLTKMSGALRARGE